MVNPTDMTQPRSGVSIFNRGRQPMVSPTDMTQPRSGVST